MGPHGTQFSDALPKLQGLACYADTHPTVFRRIEAVAKIGDKLQVLDLTGPIVRNEFAEAKNVKNLCGGTFAIDY